jgi:hypothetical protein
LRKSRFTAGLGGFFNGDKTMKRKPATEKELAAIDAVKNAIKALPRGIYLDVDNFDNTLQFWKRESRGMSYGIGSPLRCKRALCL